MAYDRYDPRDTRRDERARWRDDNPSDERGWGRGGRDERGFFERAGDEIASWFGDDDAERRRDRDDPRGPDRSWSLRDRGQDLRDRERERMSDRDNRDFGRSRSFLGREEDSNFRGPDSDRERDWSRGQERSYRPMAGDYGRAEQSFTGDFDRGHRPDSNWDRDQYRSISRAGTWDRSDRSQQEDPHYHSWRSRHMSELDRDYDDFRRENQSRFEDEFASWREKRQQKRGLLGLIREHMEVVGSDDEHLGTVDKIAGDRIILTKSDPESGGSHHSLSCSNIDRIEGERVILDCKADDARKHWRDESRSRALFEREDQGEMGPRVLDRSFSGTYR
ncbi:hypothetical protein GCM10022276_12710 [Sphingomonas limnosediminicola]|uniref:DUF2171 domain-containing protein n=1 Tax=Sphingomonas limnosediminicola TaxID=940133 RepID=A0ABP7L6B3_9SPHN